MLWATINVVSLPACNSPISVQPTIETGLWNSAEAYRMCADNYAETQDDDHAIVDYDRAIGLKSDYAEAYNNRAGC